MNTTAPAPAPVARGPVARACWALLGFAAMGGGIVGFLVPGLPSTVFFLGAAWCFARASTRLEHWFLSLPVIGALVADHRAGLGMARQAKAVSIVTMWTAIAISGYVLRGTTWLVALIVALGIVGTSVVVWRVPTKERVLAGRPQVG